ncbi:MAG: hypothetical protein ACJAVA_002145 [Flavobacteriaceae bacterium]|jgi:hypothetical protein
MSYLRHQVWINNTAPGLLELIEVWFNGWSFLGFVSMIALASLINTNKFLAKLASYILIVITVGRIVECIVPSNDLFWALYNTAWFSAFVALIYVIVIALKNNKFIQLKTNVNNKTNIN